MTAQLHASLRCCGCLQSAIAIGSMHCSWNKTKQGWYSSRLLVLPAVQLPIITSTEAEQMLVRGSIAWQAAQAIMSLWRTQIKATM